MTRAQFVALGSTAKLRCATSSLRSRRRLSLAEQAVNDFPRECFEARYQAAARRQDVATDHLVVVDVLRRRRQVVGLADDRGLIQLGTLLLFQLLGPWLAGAEGLRDAA